VRRHCTPHRRDWDRARTFSVFLGDTDNRLRVYGVALLVPFLYLEAIEFLFFFAFERVSSLSCRRGRIEYIWLCFPFRLTLFLGFFFGWRFLGDVNRDEAKERQGQKEKDKTEEIGVEGKVRATTRAWLRSHSIHQAGWRRVTSRGRIAAATLSAISCSPNFHSSGGRRGEGHTHSVLFLLLATFPSLEL